MDDSDRESWSFVDEDDATGRVFPAPSSVNSSGGSQGKQANLTPISFVACAALFCKACSSHLSLIPYCDLACLPLLTFPTFLLAERKPWCLFSHKRSLRFIPQRHLADRCLPNRSIDTVYSGPHGTVSFNLCLQLATRALRDAYPAHNLRLPGARSTGCQEESAMTGTESFAAAHLCRAPQAHEACLLQSLNISGARSG